MIYNLNNKLLKSELQKYDMKNTRIMVVNEDMTDIDIFFKKVSKKLEFPDYFGYNWNALNDCLQDFSWL